MDGLRFIELVFLFLSYVLLSNEMVPDVVTYDCPLVDVTNANNGKIIHNITRPATCKNGRNTSGCCVDRFYCDYNTSHIDFTLYGPPGFRTPCQSKEVCCPQNYILPIPISNTTDSMDIDGDDDNDAD